MSYSDGVRSGLWELILCYIEAMECARELNNNSSSCSNDGVEQRNLGKIGQRFVQWSALGNTKKVTRILSWSEIETLGINFLTTQTMECA